MLCVFGSGGRGWEIMRIKDKIQQWSDNLKPLSGTDRLEYIIELGRKLLPLDEKFKIDSFKIHGCASNLWLVPRFEKDTLVLSADADAFITKGTAYMVLDILNGQRYGSIKKIKREDFAPLGMAELLSVQRQNGLGLLITTIKKYADSR
jgi:cysteine desulfuration protein SufE